MLARINKKRWSLKKEKIKQNLNVIAEDFSLKKLVYIQSFRALCQPFFLINCTRKLFWHSNLNEPQRKNFVLITIQLSEVNIQPSFELFELLIQMSSLFIHVSYSKITIWEWRAEIKKFDLVYRITRPIIFFWRLFLFSHLSLLSQTY